MQNAKLKIKNYKVLSLVLGIVLILSFAAIIFLVRNRVSDKLFTGQVGSFVAKPVLAEETYPLFFCPCCGQPLNKKKICCGTAKERIDYIDFLVQTKTSEEEIILAYVKKYGLNSFVDKNKAEEFRKELVASAPADRPVISINPDSYDFGDVSQKKGKVYTYFDLKNGGKSDLIIDRLETSCGCTFVSLIFGGKESPFFTMPGHGYENPEWGGVSIPAGETAQLKIMYDPDVHKDFRGFAIREIYIYSNDPIDFEKKVQIELNQVD